MITILILLIWGSLCNCRHPGPRRVWDGGSEPRILPPLPRLPWLPWLRWRVPKTQILLLYAILESLRPPSEIWFWTTLHHFWHTRSDFEQPSINFEGWPLGEPNPGFLRKKRPLRACQNQILAFWEKKKGPCGHAKTNSWLWFSKKVIVWIS